MSSRGPAYCVSKHDIEIRDMHDPAVAEAASGYGIRRLPAVIIDGKLAERCAGRGLDEVTLVDAILTGRGFTPASARRSPAREGDCSIKLVVAW